MMRFTSGQKPMSSMRSASSSTRISTWERSQSRWLHRSSRRPGVATRTSTPRRSACGLRFVADAAVDNGDTVLGEPGGLLCDALDLQGELASRRDDERGGLAAAGLHALQQRQHERGGLAGARLGAADDVAAFDD